MKFFPRGAWRYALLLVVLFSIAAIATWQVIDFITERFLSPENERAVQGFSVAVWMLTMGLMFLAGALGLLAMSTMVEQESRHRIARVVNRMNYLSDGLLALDYLGHIRGANLAIRALAQINLADGKRGRIGDIFPALTEDDMRRLLNRNNPCEIETLYPSGLRMLRLRSQPAEGLILVFVSDITEQHATKMRQQQNAKLQLLGRIAGGVAHDFSNILSAISGHAVLIQRFGGDKNAVDNSIGIIFDETQRGVRLSRQLLVLSRSSGYEGQSSANLAENIREAKELLSVALSAEWELKCEANGTFPVVPLSPVQIVQIVLNLGLLAADALKKPGRIEITLKRPDGLAGDFASYAAIITILATLEPSGDLSAIASERRRMPGDASADLDAGGADSVPRPSSVMGMIDTTGVIPSVVRALIEDAGGTLAELFASSGKSLYRICLPHASKLNDLTHIKSVIKGPILLNQWRILLASADKNLDWLVKTLSDLKAVVERTGTIDALLNAIDRERKPSVIIVDTNLFGDDTNGLLKAMHKIAPDSGMVVICRKPGDKELGRVHGHVVLDSDSLEEAWLDAIVKCRQSV